MKKPLAYAIKAPKKQRVKALRSYFKRNPPTDMHLDDWRLIAREYPSPDHFIDASFYFMIGAALQRRVWIGGVDSKPIFGNPFMLFVATPGIGKGLMSEDVKGMFYSLPFMPEKHQDRAIQARLRRGKDDGDPELLFPLAADSTSFEKLVSATKSAIRHIAYTPTKPTQSGQYSHHSITFILDEVTSIFKKNSGDTLDFLLTSYTGAPFKRDTHLRDVEYLRNTCTSLLACTQPDRLLSLSREDTISSGFLSRTLIIYGAKNRFEKLLIPAHEPEQEQAKLRIRSHLKKIAKLFGDVTYTPEAFEYFRDYWENPDTLTLRRTNRSGKLDGYYARKNVHMHKLVMAIHFADDATLRPIELESVKKARFAIDAWEKDMHLAFGVGGRNELAQIGGQIIKVLKREGAKSEKEIFIDFIDQVTFAELHTLLSDLVTAGQLRSIPTTGIPKYGAAT